MAHYALVNAGSNPLRLDDSRDPHPHPHPHPHRNGHSQQQQQLQHQHSALANPRAQLLQVFEHYAELYPNPRLVEEYRLKNELLQAASAASTAQQQQQQRVSKSRKSGGFFARLFGSSTNSKEDSQSDMQQLQPQHESPVTPQLVYSDKPNENDDGSLCGTQQSLDVTCIPVEAYSVARFHIASQRTRMEHPNSLRWGPLAGRPVPTNLVIVSLGVIAEFQPNQESTFQQTSDRQALLDYSASYPGEFQLPYARACAISPNCIAVSWGFQDGLIGIYRRIQLDNSAENANTQTVNVGWELFWMVGPSRPVLEAIGDVFHDDQDHPGSPLLRVSDVIPLRVETGDPRQPLVATLVISRLGGYLELMALPSDLWFGPVLTPDSYQRPKPTRSKQKRKGNQQQRHYAAGANIGSPSVALNTPEYHVDLISLEALRTTVGPDTSWDENAFPGVPPAEFVLAASGVSHQGVECISFWTVSTLFYDQNNPQASDGLPFQVHSTLLDVATVTTGPHITVFCTPQIMEHWRQPRHVELQRDAPLHNHDDSEGITDSDAKSSKDNRVTTISTVAPIVSMQFEPSSGSEPTIYKKLALLDWNGSITLLECATLERLAAHQLLDAEFAKFKEMEGNHPLTLCEIAMTRTEFARRALSRQIQGQVGSLHWLGEVKGNEQQYCSPLVLLVRECQNMAVVTFSNQHDDNRAPNGTQLRTKATVSVISLPFPAEGATMGDIGSGDLSFLSRRLDNNGSTIFKLFVMQELEPAAIVEALAKEGKYEEAVAAAKKLDELDQAALADVLEECHSKLWKSKRDIGSLADTQNISYIMSETLSICESKHPVAGMTMDKFRVLCRFAIAMGRNHAPAKESLALVRNFLNKLETYNLLCRYFDVEPNLETFRKDFFPTPIARLARSLAERGDIAAFSMVLFRHRPELVMTIFDILEGIPLTVSPEDFVHLLPVIKNEKISDTFIPSVGSDSLLHWSQMPEHLKEIFKVSVVHDRNDEQLVLDSNAGNSVSQTPELANRATQWYVERSSTIQQFTGNMRDVIVLCEVGLQSMGLSIEKVDPFDVPAVLQPLFRTWRSATSLHQILLQSSVAFDDEESDELGPMIISTDDLLSMEASELIELVLSGETSYSNIVTRCTEYLQPLLMEGERDSGCDGGDKLSAALSDYCEELAEQCFAEAQEQDITPDIIISMATKALGTCAAIASSSKTSMPKKERMISDKYRLTTMALQVLSKVSISLEQADMPPYVNKELIEALWTIYEALPDRMPLAAGSSDTWSPLLHRADTMYKNLICVDILSKWPGCRPFPWLAKRVQENIGFTKQVGTGVIMQLCESYLACRSRTRNQKESTALLCDILSDISEINSSCCADSLGLPQLLCNYLVRPLLTMEQYHSVVEYLGTQDVSLVDRELVKSAVLEYIDDVVFGENEDGDLIMSAMRCQDVIGPVFPELKGDFIAVRRYLDAAHFVATVIYKDRRRQPFNPVQLRSQPAIDVIESILCDIPECIVRGCPRWKDLAFARDANSKLRVIHDAANEEVGMEIESKPDLPAGAIFHLATVLGLNDGKSALVVQCRVIHHAIRAGLHGAAAAICRSMLQGSEIDAGQCVEMAKLGAVVEVVSVKEFADLDTKKELCQAALRLDSYNLEVSNCQAFDEICAIAASLDLQTNRGSPFSHQDVSERQTTLLCRPVARLQQDILKEYNASIHGLFSDLQSQASSGLVHDSLMNALSRFVIYWCVSDAKGLKQRLLLREQIDATDNLSLGCGLILQIPSLLTAKNCTHELQKIAADQAANVATEARFGSDNRFCTPDPELVKRLIGRGYSENASRRAAIMTRNAGYTQALGWAVAHTMDADFNKPIAFVLDPSKKYIDEEAIQRLQKCLYATQVCLDDPSVLKTLLSFLDSIRQGQAPVTPPIPKVTSVTTEPPKILPKGAPPAHVPPKPKPKTGADRTSVARASDGETRPTSQLAKDSVQQPAEVGTTPVRPLPKVVPLPERKQQAERLTVNRVLPKVPKATVDRSELLKRGQEALLKRRGGDGAVDRRKLIEEGKALLRNARTIKPSNGAQRQPAMPVPSNPERPGSGQNGMVPPQAPRAPTNETHSESLSNADDNDGSDNSGWDFDSFDDI